MLFIVHFDKQLLFQLILLWRDWLVINRLSRNSNLRWLAFLHSRRFFLLHKTRIERTLMLRVPHKVKVSRVANYFMDKKMKITRSRAREKKFKSPLLTFTWLRWSLFCYLRTLAVIFFSVHIFHIIKRAAQKKCWLKSDAKTKPEEVWETRNSTIKVYVWRSLIKLRFWSQVKLDRKKQRFIACSRLM